jgi:Uma2 family endonuclease
MMAPPLDRHQQISMELCFQIRSYLEGKTCKVFAAPYGVRLFPKKDNSDDTVFLPDIVVICDEEKRDERGCNGPPDMIIEIISPSTAKYDRIYKLRKYEKAGVREYWIVDPETKSVQVFILKDGQYVASGYDETEKALVAVLKDCEIDLQAVFAE